MQTVLIVIHLMIVLALVGVVLIQRSEGGGLGIGGGSGFMSARGTANALTRTTAILATLFFVTSLGLAVWARYESKPTDILDRLPTTTNTNDLLNSLSPQKTEETSRPIRTPFRSVTTPAQRRLPSTPSLRRPRRRKKSPPTRPRTPSRRTIRPSRRPRKSRLSRNNPVIIKCINRRDEPAGFLLSWLAQVLEKLCGMKFLVAESSAKQ